MSKIDNAPLLEAVFEIRWGVIDSTQLKFSKQEETLFPGIVSANASNEGFNLTEPIAGMPPFPHQVTTRFRKSPGSSLCIQTGLGIFTVNQIAEGYDWDIFKVDIENALKIFKKSNDSNIIETLDNATILLRFHDAFFMNGEESFNDYLLKHFNVVPELPSAFYSNPEIENNVHHIHIKFEIPLADDLGVIAITIINAIINDREGLLAEIVIQTNTNSLASDQFDTVKIMNWLAKAHSLQIHTFNTIIKESAYKNGNNN